jgi:hypothetical protein
MPRDLRDALLLAEERLIADGLRGRLCVEPFHAVLRVDWVPPWHGDASTSDRESALRLTAEALTAEGFQAQWAPMLGWVRVMPTMADLIDADAPKTAEDSVRDGAVDECEEAAEAA